MAYDPEFRASVVRLLKRLNVSRESVIVVHESDEVSKMVSRDYLAVFQDVVKDGTVSVMGDCTINTQAMSTQSLTTQERLVLSSGPMLQLLTLQEECYYVSHPSLMIASVGKYARYLARSHDLDFPFGPDSVFNDFYGMDAILVFIGENHDLVESKYALSQTDAALIRKNVTSVGNETLPYLDYAVDLSRAQEVLFNSDLLLSESMGNHRLYGVSYKKYIEHLRSSL